MILKLVSNLDTPMNTQPQFRIAPQEQLAHLVTLAASLAATKAFKFPSSTASDSQEHAGPA
jgi:hypothetical protein